jgi:chromatin remodeling complex protein RSC6
VDTLTKKKKPVATPTVLSTVPATVAPTATATTVPVVASAASEPATSSATTTAQATDAVVPDNVLSTIIDKVNTLSAAIKDIQANLKVLSKEYDKQQKIIEKAQKKRLNAKNSPSGFAKPNKISDELCDFIGVPHGTEKSRTDITRLINAYVKEHNLNKPENKRFILPDDKLKKILNVGDSEEINYFILQRLISHHFPASASKTTAKPVAATVATTATATAK